MNVFIGMLVLASVWFVASCFYQYGVRPVLLDAVRFRLFKYRDQLRAMAAGQEGMPSTFAWQYLEHGVNRSIEACDEISVGEFIEYLLTHRSLDPSEDSTKFDREATTEQRRIQSSILTDLLLLLLVNSPVYSFLLGGLCLGLGLFFLVSKGFDFLVDIKKWLGVLMELGARPAWKAHAV